MQKSKDFFLSYAFNAPKEMVFNAFSNADALNEWWGPVETKNSVVSLDFTEGGIFHFRMDYNGHISYGRFLFRTIQPYDLLEFTNAFADENAKVIPAPFDVRLPDEILYRLHFTEQNGKTTIEITGEALNGDNEQINGFNSIIPSMEEGFGATFGELKEYLSKTIG